MRTLILLLTSVLWFSPITADAQDSRAALETVAKALGATGLKSIEIQGGGTVFQVGQAYTAGTAWPEFNVRSFTRVVNYDTASLRDEILRTRALEPPKGGGPYVRGEHKQVFVLSGDHAWNVMGETAAAAPITLADRQFQLWSTPHGVIKAAMRARARCRAAPSSSRSPAASRRPRRSTPPTSSSGSTRRSPVPSSATWRSRSATPTIATSAA